MTLSDAYHGQSPHRHKDSSPKSPQAKRDDRMFEHTAAPQALVVIENARSKAFPRATQCTMRASKAGVAANGRLSLLECR